MYIITAFMGKALAGARAISQDFLTLRRSVSAIVGALRIETLELAARLKEDQQMSSVTNFVR